MTSEGPLKEGTQVFPPPVQRAFIPSSLLRELWGEGVLPHNKISVSVGVVTKQSAFKIPTLKNDQERG